MTGTRPARPAAVALTTHPSALGDLLLGVTEDALVYCGFQDEATVRARIRRAGLAEAPAAGERHLVLFARARTELDEYLAGTRRAFTLPLDLALATPFSRETVLALDGFVPYGRTSTYKELAEALSRPRASRAVGTALGANPLCVVLPCHRILASDGSLAGYAGGLDAKRRLLALEHPAA
ncbi:methylated-DNA--[protein]-cysteine S-methyltransferase [Streptomyces sp. NRRL S-87]|uniref:methylated-DNA--[protein]-cysteine S-methyltransferase n=1 Tax=Streptomyces sp. NRRL S-87 TaxID=1463920 RepID=UPI0004C1893B|nr:methylated-DNA--[protein]-cysteine S-methyltransferase [Streptomyces sp. NRRL S-87]